jgi:hypothetical protein
MAGARLQNGKLGESTTRATNTFSTDRPVVLGGNSQWAFGGQSMGGAPGLSNAQPRANSVGLSSFAQTIGGSQSHTPLNLE